jgi:hypothetical protein
MERMIGPEAGLLKEIRRIYQQEFDKNLGGFGTLIF